MGNVESSQSQSSAATECFLPFLRPPMQRLPTSSSLLSVPLESSGVGVQNQKTTIQTVPCVDDGGSLQSHHDAQKEEEEDDVDVVEKEDVKPRKQDKELPSNTNNNDPETAVPLKKKKKNNKNPLARRWFSGESQKSSPKRPKEQQAAASRPPKKSRDETTVSSAIPKEVHILGGQKLKTGVILPPTTTARRTKDSQKKTLPPGASSTATLTIAPPPAHAALAEEFAQGMTSIQREADRSTNYQPGNDPSAQRAIHLLCKSNNNHDSVHEKLLQFLAECDSFHGSNKKVEVSLGYHYTSPEYLSCIQKYGLLNRQERRKLQICVRENGQTHGLGIYTSSNPMAFHKFRDHATLGLYVLRLSGVANSNNNNNNNNSSGASTVTHAEYCDTVTKQRGIGKDVMVLRSSAQCVVLGHFRGHDLHETAKKDFAAQILVAHGKLVKLIRQTIQRYCDENLGSIPPRPHKLLENRTPLAPISERPNHGRSQRRNSKQQSSSNKQRQKNNSRRSMATYACLKYGAPKTCLMVTSLKECTKKVEPSPQLPNKECSICFEKFPEKSCVYRKSRFFKGKDEDNDDDDTAGSLVALKRCGHVFHRECLREALKFDPKCPICRTISTEPIGKCPSGRMEIGLDPDLLCEGFEEEQQHGRDDNMGTWRIHYTIRAGTQKPYHDNPGVEYSPTSREAFVPNTEHGRRLLKRLTYAFSRGLTFTVGTSLTSGKENVVVWASIHHKTRPYSTNGVQNAHSFPDKGYFINCNEELDALGVPQHDDPSLQIIFSTKCATSINFGSLFATDYDKY